MQSDRDRYAAAFWNEQGWRQVDESRVLIERSRAAIRRSRRAVAASRAHLAAAPSPATERRVSELEDALERLADAMSSMLLTVSDDRAVVRRTLERLQPPQPPEDARGRLLPFPPRR